MSETKTGAVAETIEVVKTVVYALLIALFLRVIFFQPFTIPSASMEPNLYEGDYIIVSKFSYGWSRHSIPFSPKLFDGRIFERQAKRGDIVVFKLPRDGHTDYIKRIIGLPGDRIQMRQGLLYLNDKLVDRKFVGDMKPEEAFCTTDVIKGYEETLPTGKQYLTQDCRMDLTLDDTGTYVVPEGFYFAMGDNRDNSEDSRVPPEEGGVGFVPAENLVGKAQIILLSWKPEASIFKPWTWITEAQPSRFFKLLK